MADRTVTVPDDRTFPCCRRGQAGFYAAPGIVRLILAAALLAGLPAGAPLAADTGQIAQEKEKLQQLRERISNLKGDLESVRGEHDAQQAALEQTDKAIGRISAELRRLDGREAAARQELAQLESERDAVRSRLGRMHAVLARELQAAYRNGRQERIKLLLNQDDPAMVARMLTYQGYFTQARSRRMEDFRATLDELHTAEQVLLEQQAMLAGLRSEQEQNSAQLAAEKDRQGAILADLKQRLASGTSQLGALEADEQRVNKLLDRLQQALRDIPAKTGQQPLGKLKGQLEWPVAGKVSMNYGAQQAAGKMRSRGVHIATRSGAEIHAIARGRVVFADWLRGFGLLMILDHGDGYMSLYGENSSLYKGVGEWVGRGEVIAAAGNSGGQLRTGLYLELRKDGQPVNPAGWFKGQPAAQRAGRGRATDG
jgi:septal ring factor EnvC (AmiA/AmiB activator)